MNGLWFGNEKSYKQREEAIREANESGEGYETVRCLQQVSQDRKTAVDLHIAAYQSCMNCRLGGYMLGSSKVFYRGYIPCGVLYLGEAPGINEKTHCLPFIGDSGKVLDRIIMDTHLRLSEGRGDNCLRWCITNSVLCIPFEIGEIRKPHKDEIKACNPRLTAFLNIVQPKLIVLLGLSSQDAIKLTDTSIPSIYIPHPAWMIRQGKEQELHEKKAILYLTATMKKMIDTGTLTLVGE